MASISKRGESWRVLWRLGGRGGPTQSTTWPNLELAERANQIAVAHRHRITDDQVYEAILGPDPAEPDIDRGPTVAQFADTWLASRTRLAPGQIARYRSQLDQRILPALGHIYLRELSGTDVAGFLNRLRATGLKDSTVTRYYACLHAMLAFALLEKKVDDNAAKRTDFIRDIVSHDDLGDDGDDHVYLTRYEYELILGHLKPAGRPLVEFLAGTGCRFSEGTAVSPGAVDVLGGKVRVHRAWKYDGKRWYLGTTKGRRRRTVTIGRRLAGVLADPVAQRAEDDPDGLLLTAPEGGRIIHSNFVNRFWDPAVAAAMRCQLHPPLDERGEPDAAPLAVSTCPCPTRLKQRPTMHDLRHSHVAWLIAEGRPIASISRRIGHHSTTITERVYAGILPEVVEADADAIDRFLSGESAGTETAAGTSQGRESAAGSR